MNNSVQYRVAQPYTQINSNNINFGNNTLQQTKVDIGGAKLSTLENDKLDYSKDDGKISTKDKLKNFLKGIISPVTNMLKSPKNLAMGAVAIAGGGLLIAATGGAIAPLMVAVGIVAGGIQLGANVYKAATATTDEEARLAWQGIGAGTTTVVGSVAGAKSSLKTANVEGVENMGMFKATIECFKQIPNSALKSFKAFSSGEFIANISSTFKAKNKTERSTKEKEVSAENKKPKQETTQPKTDEPPKQNTTDKPKTENTAQAQETKPASGVEDKLIENLDDLSGEEQYLEWNSEKQNSPTYEEILEDANFEAKSADNGFNAQQYLDDIDDLGKVTAKKQTQPKSTIPNSKKTMVQKDGTKITLTYDENGKIAESTITKPDKTIVIKEYKNGKCINSGSIKKASILESKEYKYTDNGKIASIQNNNSKKIFNYNQDGEFIGYSELDYLNNVIKAYDAKGKLTNTISDFSADIKNTINKLNGKHNFDRSMLIESRKVIRKTTVIDKQTGNTIDAYITETSGGWGASKKFNIYVENAGEYESIGAVTVDPNSTWGNGKYGIKNLYGSQSQTVDRYKGAGTELLKQCSIDSFNYGEKGIFSLQSGNYESDAFYRHIGLYGTAGHFELAECSVSDFLLR